MTIQKNQLTALERELLNAIETPYGWGSIAEQDILAAIENPQAQRWSILIDEHVSKFWSRLSVESKLVCIILTAEHACEAENHRWDN